MTAAVNPKIVTDNLVFCMDNSNIRSYAGPALQNIATGISPTSGTVPSYFSFVPGTESVCIRDLGYLTSAYVDMYNDYPNSGLCCPNPYTYGWSIPAVGNTLYTYAIVYKSVNRYTHPNFMYHYEYNGGTYLTEYGVNLVPAYNGQETSLGDDWYWSRAKFTTLPTCTTINTGCWMYQYATYNRLYVAKVLIAPGDWTQLHPKYWPDPGTTRTNAQIIRDLTGNNTVTPTNLIYSTDGSFSFNNTYLDLNSNNIVTGNNPFTVEGWYTTTGTTTDEIFGNYGTGSTSNTLWISGRYGIFINQGVYFPGSPLPAGTYHLAVTRDSDGNISLYKNGQLSTTGVLSASIPVTYNFRIGADVNGGSEPFTGSIYVIRVYNRVLSAQEVSQNFNALRGRFGL